MFLVVVSGYFNPFDSNGAMKTRRMKIPRMKIPGSAELNIQIACGYV